MRKCTSNLLITSKTIHTAPVLESMGSSLCWTCIKTSSQTSFVVRGFQTGQSTLEVSIGASRQCIVRVSFPAAKGFPYPIEDPYKMDPTTGYPTPEVYIHASVHCMKCIIYCHRTVPSMDGQTTSSLRHRQQLIRTCTTTQTVALIYTMHQFKLHVLTRLWVR